MFDGENDIHADVSVLWHPGTRMSLAQSRKSSHAHAVAYSESCNPGNIVLNEHEAQGTREQSPGSQTDVIKVSMTPSSATSTCKWLSILPLEQY